MKRPSLLHMQAAYVVFCFRSPVANAVQAVAFINRICIRVIYRFLYQQLTCHLVGDQSGVILILFFEVALLLQFLFPSLENSSQHCDLSSPEELGEINQENVSARRVVCKDAFIRKSRAEEELSEMELDGRWRCTLCIDLLFLGCQPPA